MALLTRFDTPARIRDVPASSPFYDAWSTWISNTINGTTAGTGGGAFYDPTVTNVNVAGEKSLTWMGFPREKIMPANRDDRTPAYVVADDNPATRRDQNEYFEWQVTKNTAGKITKVIFITELPEYYEELWKVDPDAVVAIYRNLVSPAVIRADLGGTGSYNKFNDWNTTDGIVHMIQGINKLSLAIGLAKGGANSTSPFGDNFEASPSGSSAPTSVDPRVGIDVHMLVRKGLYVTLRDPVGFYMVGWNDSGFTKPNGRPAGNYWRIVRGSPGMAMRVEYKVPPGRGFVVGDLKIGGRRIEYGGQLAEQITVSITGTAGIPGRS